MNKGQFFILLALYQLPCRVTICRWHLKRLEKLMLFADILRLRATQCYEYSEQAKTQPEARRFKRLGDGWSAVADAQTWLDGETLRTDASWGAS